MDKTPLEMIEILANEQQYELAKDFVNLGIKLDYKYNPQYRHFLHSC